MTTPYPWRPARIRVGTVGRAHGLDGRFRVADPCGWWEFPAAAELLVDGVARRIEFRGGDAAAPLIRLAGIDDRTAAEALRGAALELPREVVPEPDPDAFFRFDLIGCVVLQADGTPLGTVTAVEDGVAHDILVVGDGVRLPFVRAVVPEVEVANRRIRLADGFRPA
jgi:16S rRNA processing protein RimM